MCHLAPLPFRVAALCPRSSLALFLLSFLLICLDPFSLAFCSISRIGPRHQPPLRGISLSWPSLASLSLSRRCPCYSVNIAPKDIAMPRGVNKSVVSVTYFFHIRLHFRHAVHLRIQHRACRVPLQVTNRSFFMGE